MSSFDCVVSYDVLEHVEDPRRALSEIARVLKPAGRHGWCSRPTSARAPHTWTT